jgi:hypothetical protein
MSFWKKLLGKDSESKRQSKTVATGGGNVIENLLKDFQTEFGEFVLHRIDNVSSMDEVMPFFGQLSFIHIVGDNILCKPHTKVGVVDFTDGMMVFIGGQLSADENYETILLAHHFKLKVICWVSAASGTDSQMYKNLMIATQRLKDAGIDLTETYKLE